MTNPTSYFTVIRIDKKKMTDGSLVTVEMDRDMKFFS